MNATATATMEIVRDDSVTLTELTESEISLLRCVGNRTIQRFKLSRKQLIRLSPSMQSKYSKGTPRNVKCRSTVVYMVFPDKLPMCNQHFNEYFETHEIEAGMVMRLSDDEDDFANSARNYPKRRKKSSRSNGNGDEPVCQVPVPRPR
jgi:hypothetical protein